MPTSAVPETTGGSPEPARLGDVASGELDGVEPGELERDRRLGAGKPRNRGQAEGGGARGEEMAAAEGGEVHSCVLLLFLLA
jgi:hypothetical protein